MTLMEFIKSNLSGDSEFRDLAKDIQNDLQFPVDKSDKKIISYLAFKTHFSGTNSTLKKFVKEYKRHSNTEVRDIDLDAKYALLRTENWMFYKEYFPVDKVVLMGEQTDFYKVYCIDSSNEKSLFFDMKSSTDLNDISIIDEQKIHIGNATRQVSVTEAISLLESCSYETPIKPNGEIFKELIEFLKLNN